MTPKVPEGYFDARRQQILAAAAGRFARDGFHGTTMSEIAADAELSAGALYRYFSDKAALIRALAEESGHRLREAIERGLAAGGSPVDALEALTATHAWQVSHAEGLESARLTVRLWSEAIHTPEIHRELRRAYESVRGDLAALIRAGQRAGAVRRGLDPDAVARVVIALLQDAGFQALIDPEMDLSAYAETVQRVLQMVLASDADT